MKFTTTILLLIIIPILIAYYYDYKSNPKEFIFSLKSLVKGLGKGISYCLIFIFLQTLYKNFIPFKKDHGIVFNSDREKLGIPKIPDNWKIVHHYSKQFETQWWKQNEKEGHFKKIIKYGFFNIKSETDYYQNKKIKGTFAWSSYNFEDKSFEYFIEKPNENEFSFTKNGKFKINKPTIVLKFSKSEFEEYIGK